MNPERGLLPAVAVAAFLLALSLWTLAYDAFSFPREALLAVRADDAVALCRQDGSPLAETLERMRSAGATALLVRDQTWAEAAASGRVHYFPKGQAAALKALGLLDPAAAFPDDSLWLAEGEGAEPTARVFRELGIRFSTASFNGRTVLDFAEGIDLERLRAGPDPALLAATRAAELLPVYRLAAWDRNAAALLATAVDRADFPRLAYADLPRREREAFAASAERKVLDEGLFLPPRRGLGGPLAWLAAELPAGSSPRRRRDTLRDARPRLVIQGLDPGAGPEAALADVRAASEAMAALGLARTATLQGVKPRPGAPPELAWLRRGVVLVLAWVLPAACLAFGLRALLRALESLRLPLAAPVWQLAAGYGGAVAATLLGGILIDGLLGPRPPLLARAALFAPFALGTAWWYRARRPSLERRLDRPLTVRALLGLIVAVAAIALLWGCAGTHALARAELCAHWRSILVGAPSLLAAFWIRCRRQAGLKGVLEDERPLLVIGLWLPVEMIGAFVLSSAPFWVCAQRSLLYAACGALAGGLLIAGLSYYELRIRPWSLHSRWI